MPGALQEEIYQVKTSQITSAAAGLTVLLPVFNGAQYIAEAVESILRQTYTNFELLVINDGSTDDTLAILEGFVARDARVRVVSRENRGLIATLNQGLALSNTDLIVRMDADDVALPNRLERQAIFMAEHPEVAVCGTAMVFYETGEERHLPEGHDELKALSLFNTPVFHPTVIMRKSRVLAVGGYSSNAPCAEDYDLWERMLHAGSKFANLGEALLRYRLHPNVNRAKYYVKMTATSLDICGRQLERLGLPVDEKSLAMHRICCAPCPETSSMCAKLTGWLRCIENANSARGLYSSEALKHELSVRAQAFTVLSPAKQPLGWGIRLMRHQAHALLALARRIWPELAPAWEGRLASWWWDIKRKVLKRSWERK